MLAPAHDEWTIFEAAHLLRRAGFGGGPGEIKRFHAMGRRQAVESLLSPAEPIDAFPLPSWAEPERAAEDYRMMAEMNREVRRASRDMTAEEADRFRRESRRKIQRTNRRRVGEARDWWFRRMLTSKAPLREKMVLFWHDHFATSIQKVRQPQLVLEQNQLFRRHALGSFKALTRSVVKDPAMMLYLDAQTSKKGKPNENFAREVMELFTLGEGNYSEQDIKEAARAFTGYQLNRMTGKVTINRRQRDDGRKTIFGKSGDFDGPAVVELLFEQDAASRLIPRKLWEFFVAENPSEACLASLADSFRAAGYRVEPLLREIFLSKGFYASEVVRNQIKSPIQFLVQMLKELGIREAPAGSMIAAQQQLGQLLFTPPNVAGWDWGKAWINTNTLLSRYNTAGFITKGSLETAAAANGGSAMTMEDDRPMRRDRQQRAARSWTGPDYEKIAARPSREDPERLVDSLIFRLFQAPLGEKERGAFVEYARAKKGVVFTNKEVGELCHLMMSTPQYQLA